MKLKLKVNPIAIRDVKEIKEYIREENVNAINRFTQDAKNSIEKLAEFPKLGMSLSKKIDFKTDYRCFIMSDYMIFYKFNDEFLFVYRIQSCKRDYIKILFE